MFIDPRYQIKGVGVHPSSPWWVHGGPGGLGEVEGVELIGGWSCSSVGDSSLHKKHIFIDCRVGHTANCHGR